MEDVVRIHKELNRSAMPFYKEKAIDLFNEIMKKWNRMEEYQPLIFNLTEFKKALGLENSYNKEYFNEFLDLFSQEGNKTWHIGTKEIKGNIFTIVIDRSINTLEIHFNNYILDYIFTQKDIKLMQKNKKRERMSIEELETFKDRKEKFSNLMLYSKADMEGLTGKYTKRLYMLLIQFKLKGFFKMKYNQFKELMEIPETYKPHHIDQKVLNPAIEELKKANIFISKLNKDKQGGRSIKFIEITFEYKDEELEKEEKLKLKSNPKKTVLVEELEKRNNISTEENSKIAVENIRKIRQNMK